MLGHEVALRSKSGAGSLFSVTAPLGVAAGAKQGQAAAAQDLSRAREPLNDLLVLAIDNEPRVLEGMRALVTEMGLPRRSPRRACRTHRRRLLHFAPRPT